MTRVLMGPSAKWSKTMRPMSGHQNASASPLQVVRLAKLSLAVLLAKTEALAIIRTAAPVVHVKVIIRGVIADRILVILTLANPKKPVILSTQPIMNVRKTSLKKLKPFLFKFYSF